MKGNSRRERRLFRKQKARLAEVKKNRNIRKNNKKKER